MIPGEFSRKEINIGGKIEVASSNEVKTKHAKDPSEYKTR